MPHGEDMEMVPTHLWRYAQDQPFLAEVADETRRFLAELARDASIDVHLVKARPKTLASYRDKSEKKKDDGAPKYSDPATQIHDCVAARVIVYTTRARNDMANLIESRCECQERGNPGDTKHNGYDSEHLVITGLKDPAAQLRYIALTKFFDNYPGLEIQVRSVAGHAWAEYEHDIRYKSGGYKELPSNDKGRVDQYFIEAGGMRRYMDEIFDKIEELLRPQGTDDATTADEPVIGVDEPSPETLDPTLLSPASLGELIASRFPKDEPGDSLSLAVLVDQLAELGVTTVGQLEAALSNLGQGQVARLMDYPIETTRVRKLDDELLAIFLDRYVAAAADDGRRQLLRLRLRRVRGRFTIYSLEGPSGTRRPVTAARAVRDLARFVAERQGVAAAANNGFISANKGDISPGYFPKEVRTSAGPVYVATNLSRAHAESLMGELVSRVPGSGLRVQRAGDLLFEAAPDISAADSSAS
ncbi:GTP pyrophosphokinase [Micromonospora sp. DT229]|uniref:GTP pyrophosphokinase n=1 Tax=Micromonospora sp. DT229 TaxID=3393430 RepID=UPI003CE7984A